MSYSTGSSCCQFLVYSHLVLTSQATHPQAIPDPLPNSTSDQGQRQAPHLLIPSHGTFHSPIIWEYKRTRLDCKRSWVYYTGCTAWASESWLESTLTSARRETGPFIGRHDAGVDFACECRRDQPSEPFLRFGIGPDNWSASFKRAKTTPTNHSMPELPRLKHEQASNACTLLSGINVSNPGSKILCAFVVYAILFVKGSSSHQDKIVLNFVSYTTLPFHSPLFIKDSAFCLLLHILVVASPAQAANYY